MNEIKQTNIWEFSFIGFIIEIGKPKVGKYKTHYTNGEYYLLVWRNKYCYIHKTEIKYSLPYYLIKGICKALLKIKNPT